MCINTWRNLKRNVPDVPLSDFNKIWIYLLYYMKKCEIDKQRNIFARQNIYFVKDEKPHVYKMIAQFHEG